MKNYLIHSLSVLSILIVCSTSFCEATPAKINVVEVLDASPEVKSGQAELILCFSNKELADDYVSQDPYLNRIFDSLTKTDPMAVQDRKTEICVRPAQVLNDKKTISELKFRMAKADSLDLELTTLTESFPYRHFGPEIKQEARSPIYLTLRGAAFGGLTALAIDKARPALDFLSNKGDHSRRMTVATGAAIGALADIFQVLFGVKDEKQRLFIDAGAAGIGAMLETRDPNVIGLAVTLTLSQIPAVQRLTDKIAENTPKVLSWEIPVAMTGVFYLLGKRQSGTALVANKDKVLGAGTFGTLAAAVAMSKKNETTGFIVASFASLIDEICDGVSKSCQGRFDWNDLAANTIGAYMGAKLGGFFIAKDHAGHTNLYFTKAL